MTHTLYLRFQNGRCSVGLDYSFYGRVHHRDGDIYVIGDDNANTTLPLRGNLTSGSPSPRELHDGARILAAKLFDLPLAIVLSTPGADTPEPTSLSMKNLIPGNFNFISPRGVGLLRRPPANHPPPGRLHDLSQ